MRVLRTSFKSRSGEPMRVSPHLEMRVGVGITGDANALRGSPRQVLLVDQAVYESRAAPEGSLRENILLYGLLDRQLESGQCLLAGSGVLLRITMSCEPCRKLNAMSPGLAARVVGVRGTLARVVRGGRLAAGDRLLVTSERLPPLLDHFSGRVRQLLSRIPSGRVVTLERLTMMAGAPKSYVRTIPRILKGALPLVPVHRVVAKNGRVMSEHLPAQVQRLREEGIRIQDSFVDSSAIWNGDPYAGEEKMLLRDEYPMVQQTAGVA